MISREKKESVVKDFRERLSAAQAVVIAENRGLSAEDFAEFRRGVKSSGGQAQVVKNTLAKIAMTGGAFEPLSEGLNGPLIYGAGEDAAALAKAFAEGAKNHENLIIRGGALADGMLLDEAAIKKLASIPPREQLLAKLLGVLSAPAATLVRTLHAVPSGFVRALAAVRDKQDGGQ